MKSNLQNKKILLIMPFYFMYQNTISKCLQSQGAEVFLINENIEDEFFLYKLAKLYHKKLARKIETKFYKKKFKCLPGELDYIFVIKGSTLNHNVLKSLKETYVKSTYIFYQWDSVANYEYATELADAFDYKFTFDYEDAAKFGWKYRPLFFDPTMCDANIERVYDISYVASLHSERYKVLNNVKKVASNYKLNLFDYLYSEPFSFIRQKYIKRNAAFHADISDVKFTPLSLEEIDKIYDSSKCIVDYKFRGQSGLTMRTIESLGHGCKLITNNQYIKHEPFYNEKNILIYNVEQFDIPYEFIQSDFEKIPDEIIFSYTIDGWVDEIFGGGI